MKRKLGWPQGQHKEDESSGITATQLGKAYLDFYNKGILFLQPEIKDNQH